MFIESSSSDGFLVITVILVLVITISGAIAWFSTPSPSKSPPKDGEVKKDKFSTKMNSEFNKDNKNSKNTTSAVKFDEYSEK